MPLPISHPWGPPACRILSSSAQPLPCFLGRCLRVRESADQRSSADRRVLENKASVLSIRQEGARQEKRQSGGHVVQEGAFNGYRFSTEAAGGVWPRLFLGSTATRPSRARNIGSPSGSVHQPADSSPRISQQGLLCHALSSVPPPCQGVTPQAWPRWAWGHLVMSKLGPCSPDHRPVVLWGQLLHLLHGPMWRALGAQGRRAPGRDRESTAEAQPLGLPHPTRQ